jgi:hypothetical protein
LGQIEGKAQKLHVASRTLSFSSAATPPYPASLSGRFTAPYRSLSIRLSTASSPVVVVCHTDAGGERNGGEKERQRRSGFPIPVTTATEPGGFGFLSSMRVHLWSRLVESLTVEGESKRENFMVSGGFLLFPATPLTFCFGSGIKLDQLVELYFLV